MHYLIGRFLFRSGNQEHPGDKIENTTVEILPSLVGKHLPPCPALPPPHTHTPSLRDVQKTLITLHWVVALLYVAYWFLTVLRVMTESLLLSLRSEYVIYTFIVKHLTYEHARCCLNGTSVTFEFVFTFCFLSFNFRKVDCRPKRSTSELKIAFTGLVRVFNVLIL